MNTPDDKAHSPTDAKPEPPPPPPVDVISQTQHAVVINGEMVAYTATAGRLVLKAEDEKTGEKPKASIFFVAYTRDAGPGADQAAHAAARPLTFSFNGGPGSSSVWLHLGLLGPRRVVLEEDSRPLPPPYRLVDNAYSLLDKTCLLYTSRCV